MPSDSIIRMFSKRATPGGLESPFRRWLKNPNSINAENFDLLTRARSGAPGFIPIAGRRYLGGGPSRNYIDSPRGAHQIPPVGFGGLGEGGGGGVRQSGGGGGCCQALLNIAKEQLSALQAIAVALQGGRSSIGTGGGVGAGGGSVAGGGGRRRAPAHISSLHRMTAKGLSSLGLDVAAAGVPDLNPAVMALGVGLYGAAKIYGGAKKAYGLSKPYSDLLINASNVSRLTGTRMGSIAGRFMTGAGGRGYAPQWMLDMGYTMPEALSLMGSVGTDHAGRTSQALIRYAGRSKYLRCIGLDVLVPTRRTAIYTAAKQNNTQSVLKYLGQFAGALKEAAKEGIQTTKAFQGIQSVVRAAQGLGMGAPGTATAAWAASLMGGGVKSFRAGAGQMNVLRSVAGVMGGQSGLTQTLEVAGERRIMGGKFASTSGQLNTFLKRIGASGVLKGAAGAKIRSAYLDAVKAGNYSAASYILGNALQGNAPASMKWLSAGISGTMGRLSSYQRLVALSHAYGVSTTDVAEIQSGKKIAPRALKKSGMFGTGAGAGKALKLEATVNSAQFKISQAVFSLGAGSLTKGFSLIGRGIGAVQSIPDKINRMNEFLSSPAQETPSPFAGGPPNLMYFTGPYIHPWESIPNYDAKNMQGYLIGGFGKKNS